MEGLIDWLGVGLVEGEIDGLIETLIDGLIEGLNDTETDGETDSDGSPPAAVVNLNAVGYAPHVLLPVGSMALTLQ